MFLHAIATAVPTRAVTQAESWQILQQPDVRSRLSRRSLLMLQAILRNESGIEQRYFALPSIETVFQRTPDELNEAFRQEAPKLAGNALTKALAKAGVRADEIDALLICTCTGYLCPGVTSYVSEQLGLRTNVFLQDLVGLGCGAAIPLLRAGQAVLAANPNAVVACVAVEICSAAFFLDDDPGVLVSACLFGDGAAATIWRATPGPLGNVGCSAFDTVHRPTLRDHIRFEMRDGRLRNLLRPEVPELAAEAVRDLFNNQSARTVQSGEANEGDSTRPISRILSHGGGRDVLNAIEKTLPAYPLYVSRDVLRKHGNMSSPSVLFALEQALQSGSPIDTEDWWLVSFGAGFAAHSCRFGCVPNGDGTSRSRSC